MVIPTVPAWARYKNNIGIAETNAKMKPNLIIKNKKLRFLHQSLPQGAQKPVLVFSDIKKKRKPKNEKTKKSPPVWLRVFIIN